LKVKPRGTEDEAVVGVGQDARAGPEISSKANAVVLFAVNPDASGPIVVARVALANITPSTAIATRLHETECNLDAAVTLVRSPLAPAWALAVPIYARSPTLACHDVPLYPSFDGASEPFPHL
jgi:hypothetical protein